jgi:hypothetical protein
VEYQRKENLQRKPEVHRVRPVEVPLRQMKTWTYGRVSTKSYIRRHPAIIVEGLKKNTNMLNLWCGINPRETPQFWLLVSVNNIVIIFVLIILNIIIVIIIYSSSP